MSQEIRVTPSAAAPVSGTEDRGPEPPGSESPAPPRERPIALPREVLERVRERDPQALAALFDRYFGMVYGLAYRLMGGRAPAEDIAQEVFLKVHRAAHQLDPSRDPAAWLSAITTNACRDVWRSGAGRMARASHSLDQDPEGFALSASSEDPETLALRAERERLVQDALQRLPEALRVPIVLHDYQGLQHQEIAEQLGIHHAAARKRYSRAITALAALLRETLG